MRHQTAYSNYRSLLDLEKRLIAQVIHTQYKYKGQTQEPKGISFRIGEDRFKGSQIDRQFSLGNLQKTLAAQQKKQEVKPALSLEDRKMPFSFGPDPGSRRHLHRHCNIDRYYLP
jgi:hypothetical protein